MKLSQVGRMAGRAKAGSLFGFAILLCVLILLEVPCVAQSWWGWRRPAPRQRGHEQQYQRQSPYQRQGQPYRQSPDGRYAPGMMPGAPMQTPKPTPLPVEKRPPKRDAATRAMLVAAAERATSAGLAAGESTRTLAQRDGHVALVWSDSDSLSAIAKACGMTSGELLEANALTRAALHAGQMLRVPDPELQTTEALTLPKAFSPEEQMRREVHRGIRGRKQIALTFDAGGTKDGVDELLLGLGQAEAAATFFVTGEFTKKYPEVVTRIAEAGYPIHNHSWSHPPFPLISDEEVLGELELTESAVRELTGKTTRLYWRPPFGERDRRVLRLTGEAGYQSVYWTLDSLDSWGEKKSAEFVVERILHPPKAGENPDDYLDGAIVLMHVGETQTAAAVPEIIRQLRERGFELVTVEQLLTP